MVYQFSEAKLLPFFAGEGFKDSTPQLRSTLDNLGIKNLETLHKIANNSGIKIPDGFLNSEKMMDPQEDIESFINQIYPKVEIIGNSFKNDKEYFKEIFIVLLVFFEQWNNHSDAGDMIKNFFNLLSKNIPDWNKYGDLCRILGIHFFDYESLLTPEQRQKVVQGIMKKYPLDILPSLDTRELDEETSQKFNTNKAVPTNGIALLSTPLKLDFDNHIESYEFTACANAESRHIEASESPERATRITYEGKLIASMKKHKGEWSLLAIHTTTQDGRPCLVEGGIYQFHDIRLDPKLEEVDLATLKKPIKIIPIRMWNQQNIRKDGPTFVDVQNRYDARMATNEQTYVN